MAHNISPIKSLWRFFQTFNSVDPGPILPNFEPIQAFIAFLDTCKNEEDPMKMEELECSQDFLHYNPMGAICWKPEF